MLPFEEEICQHFDRNAIPYRFDEPGHKLTSESVEIRFMPVLSTHLTQVRVEEDDHLVYLWEDIFNRKKDLVISRINSLLGMNKRIHGRQTRISKLNKEQYGRFLEKNHLMEPTTAKYRLGLYFQDELVAVAGFGRACPIDHEGRTYRSHELIRFCNKSGYTVVGGLSKLLNYFVEQYMPEHLMTYVDREWSVGRTYLQLGFKLISTTSPQEFYLSPADGQRYRREALATSGKDYSDWLKLTNLGNNKYIKIFT